MRVLLSKILYFCDKAYVTMTYLSEVMPLLQKDIDINETVWNSLAGKVYTQVLQWGSDLQDCNTADVLLLADCVYYMEVPVLTIITEDTKLEKYRALSIPSLKPKFTCLHGIARLMFLCF